MKCVECVDYAECSKKHNLTIKRKHCPMAKFEYVQTNADRIRAMSDEELAVLLAEEIPHGDCYGCELECCTCDGDKFTDSCQNAFYKWLKQPVKENE